MKIRIIAFSVLAMMASASSNAQSSATATATANLVTPISIEKDVDMDFGTLAASATPGTVVVATDDSRSANGGVTLFTSAPTAAKFTVTGEGSTTFSISLPNTITLVSGQNNLIVNNFVSAPSTTGTLNAGTATIAVGATLNVPANAAAGVYTNTTDLTVTVNYN